MLIIKRLLSIFILIASLLITQINAQSIDIVLKDTSITTTATFTATNSITSGPNFTVANGGNVTFLSGNVITLNPGTTVKVGGVFQAFTGSEVDVETEYSVIPDNFIVLQNYPNPFNPSTTIRYGLPNNGFVTIVVYNLFGQEIKTLLAQNKHAGYHTVSWDGRNEMEQKVSSGIFFYKVDAGKYTVTRKMILIK